MGLLEDALDGELELKNTDLKKLEGLYLKIMRSIMFDDSTKDGVYRCDWNHYHKFDNIPRIIPSRFLSGKSVHIIQHFNEDSDYYHDGDIWMVKGKKRVTATYTERGTYRLEENVLMEVRKEFTNVCDVNPYKEISRKLHNGRFGSMRTMQNVCIEIIREHKGVEVDFFCTARDSRVTTTTVVDRRFWVEIRGHRVILKELPFSLDNRLLPTMGGEEDSSSSSGGDDDTAAATTTTTTTTTTTLPHRTDSSGVGGEEAGAGGAAVGVGGASSKRLKSVPGSPAIEFKQVEYVAGEDTHGRRRLGGSIGIWSGEGGISTDLLPPVWTPEASEGSGDSDVDGLVVDLGAEPHWIEDIHGHAKAMGAAGASGAE